MPAERGNALVRARTGRPALYDIFIAAEVLMRLARGEPLTRICMDAHMPSHTTVQEWVIDDVDGFAARYARARMIAAELIFEQTLEISDNTSGDFFIELDKRGNPQVKVNHYEINRARLMVDTRKFFLSKLYPKKYGEMAEKLSAEKDRAADEAARDADAMKLPALRPQITREEWLKIHGISSTAAGASQVAEHSHER